MKGYHSVFRKKYLSVFSDIFIERAVWGFVFYTFNILREKKDNIIGQLPIEGESTDQHGTTWLHMAKLKQPPESMEKHPMSLAFPVKVITTGQGWQNEVVCRQKFLMICVKICVRRVWISWRESMEVREGFLHKVSLLLLMILHLFFFSHQNIYSTMWLPCLMERNRSLLGYFYIPPREG